MQKSRFRMEARPISQSTPARQSCPQSVNLSQQFATRPQSEPRPSEWPRFKFQGYRACENMNCKKNDTFSSSCWDYISGLPTHMWKLVPSQSKENLIQTRLVSPDLVDFLLKAVAKRHALDRTELAVPRWFCVCWVALQLYLTSNAIAHSWEAQTKPGSAEIILLSSCSSWWNQFFFALAACCSRCIVAKLM